MSHKILIIEDYGSILQRSTNMMNFVVLPHPKIGNLVFVIMDDIIYELQNFEPRSHGSWFIDQRVSSADSIFVGTKIDPRFLLLPYISKTSRYSLIDQILTPVAGCDRFALKDIGSWKMHEFCDVNDKYDDEVFYRHNEEKLMSWLTGKVLRCGKLFCHNRVARLQTSANKGFASGFNAAAQSARPSTSKVDAAVDGSSLAEGGELVTEDDLRCAFQVVSDYLSDEVAERCARHLADSGVLKLPSAADVLDAEGSGTRAGGLVLAPCATAEEKRKASWEADLEV
jgi:hypothetical protein